MELQPSWLDQKLWSGAELGRVPLSGYPSFWIAATTTHQHIRVRTVLYVHVQASGKMKSTAQDSESLFPSPLSLYCIHLVQTAYNWYPDRFGHDYIFQKLLNCFPERWRSHSEVARLNLVLASSFINLIWSFQPTWAALTAWGGSSHERDRNESKNFWLRI